MILRNILPALATQKPLGENLATVVGKACPRYTKQSDGSTRLFTTMNFPLG